MLKLPHKTKKPVSQGNEFFAASYKEVGGDKRDRTADLMTASHALSQLSYTPRYFQIGQEARYEVLGAGTGVRYR